MWRKILGASALGLATLALPAQAQEAGYPLRPIKLVVGFAPGGGTDASARYFAKRLGEKLGQPVFVENRPGKSGAVAIQGMLNAPADGYTIVTGTNSVAIDAALKESSYDWRTALAPIGFLTVSSNLLVVNAKSPIRTTDDLIREAKRRRLTFGSAGVSSVMHMSGELLKYMAGAEMTHVPYRGQAPAETALMSGEVDFLFNSVWGSLPHIESGKIRPIAYAGTARFPSLPNVPTLDEAGVKGFVTTNLLFLMVSAKTPPAIVKKLETTMDEIDAEEATKAFAAQRSAYLVPGGGKVVVETLIKEEDKWKKVINSEGFGKSN